MVHILQLVTAFAVVGLSYGATKDATRCYADSPQCARYNTFSTSNVALSWSEARQDCQSRGSELAYFVDPVESGVSYADQFAQMQAACAGTLYGQGVRFVGNCWIGAHRSPSDQSLYDFVNGGFVLSSDESVNNQNYGIERMWSCVLEDPTNCEPDDTKASATKPKSNPNEDYLALFKNRLYYVSDFPEDGNPNDPDFAVNGYLCMNNEFNPQQACICDCNVCHIHGDPHILTFDGSYYHPMGTCVYNYVTPCSDSKGFDEFLSYDISARHSPCFKAGASCVDTFFISLYSPQDFSMPTLVVAVQHETDANGNLNTNWYYHDCGTIRGRYQCLLDKRNDAVVFGQDIQYYSSSNAEEPWCFSISEPACSNTQTCTDTTEYEFEFRLYTFTKFEAMRMSVLSLSGFPSVEIYKSDFKIWTTHCTLEDSCGLCGFYDLDNTNDWLVQTARGEPDFSGPSRPGNDLPSSLTDPIFTEAQVFKGEWQTDKLLGSCSSVEAKPCDASLWNICPSTCDCYADSDGDGVFSNIVSVPVSTEADTCAYDLCACIGMDYAQADAFGIAATFGKDSETLSKDGDLQVYETYNAFLKQIGRPECANMARCSCSKTNYCPRPDYRPIVCETISANPTTNPTKDPTPFPSAEPTQSPHPVPTASPTDGPTDYPTPNPTNQPTPEPTANPSPVPTASPTDGPTDYPTPSPTNQPTPEPTANPSPVPTASPTDGPTDYPTPNPTKNPTSMPTPAPIYQSCDPDAPSQEVMFIVDDTCGLNTEQCGSQNAFVSSLMQLTKGTGDPRVAVLFCNSDTDGAVGNDYFIKFDDEYNNGIDRYAVTEAQITNLFRKLSSREDTECGQQTYNPINECIVNSLDQFPANSRSKRLVLISNCRETDNNQDVCEHADLLNEQGVTTTVVNVPMGIRGQRKVRSTDYACLARSRRFVTDETTMNDAETDSVLRNVADDLCTKVTLAPTANPSTKPTPSPSSDPTRSPTSSPTYDACEEAPELDVIFVVDHSCAMTKDQCSAQQQFVSNLVQKMKDTGNPRLGYMKCDGAIDISSNTNRDYVAVDLDNSLFNNYKRPDIVSSNMMDLYDYVANLDCSRSNRQPIGDCVARAIDEFDMSVERDRKIVLITACEETSSSTTFPVCSLADDLDRYKISAININIGLNVDQTTHECILNGDSSRAFTYYESSPEAFYSEHGLETMDAIQEEMCEEPTPSPTMQPSQDPTASPTDTPTTTTTYCPPVRHVSYDVHYSYTEVLDRRAYQSEVAHGHAWWSQGKRRRRNRRRMGWHYTASSDVSASSSSVIQAMIMDYMQKEWDSNHTVEDPCEQKWWSSAANFTGKANYTGPAYTTRTPGNTATTKSNYAGWWTQ